MAWPTLIEALLYTEIRALLNEPTARLFTDAQLLIWINRATAEIAQMSLCVEDASDSIALATGVWEYAHDLVGNLSIEAMWYTGSASAVGTSSAAAYALTKVHARMIQHVCDDTAGPPRFWAYVPDEKIIFWPPPAAGQNGFLVQVLYYRSIDGTFTGLPLPFQHLVIWYTLAKAYERLNKYNHAQQYMSIFNNFLIYLRSIYHQLPVDSRDMMQLPDRTQIVR